MLWENPSKFQEGWSAGLRPVESVNWFDCLEFISKLNEKETELRLGLSGDLASQPRRNGNMHVVLVL